MRGMILTAAAALAALPAARADAQQESPLSQQQFVSAVDGCLAANAKSEFDTAQSVLSKVQSSCDMTGTVRFPARGHPILGDILSYDAAAGRFVWSSRLDESNRFYGGGVSPYSLAVHLDASGRPMRPDMPSDVEAVLREVGNASFWMLPLFRTDQARDTYQASNAFGASREVARIRETRYGIATHIPSGLTSLLVMEVPMDAARARELADHLDIALTFRIGQVCRVCYKSTTIERGTRPTVRTPIDEEITTRVVFVNVLRMDLIDRRSGTVVYASTPAGTE